MATITMSPGRAASGRADAAEENIELFGKSYMSAGRAGRVICIRAICPQAGRRRGAADAAAARAAQGGAERLLISN